MNANGGEPPEFGFRLRATDGEARSGIVTTAHGTVATPAFMPVGTAGTVKAMFPEHVRETGADVVLGNTYHLMLRPGAERIQRLGGLHAFMRWPHTILTDSGGFQVMSLAKLREISEQGVKFQSHIDGATHMLTPERAMEFQAMLGSDIQMQLDECTPFPSSEQEASTSMRLSLRWAERSRRAFEGRTGQAPFGIVQGSVYPKLRLESAARLVDLDFPGYAVGGLAVGEGQYAMLQTLDLTVPALPQSKPRYLMGVGTPQDILRSVARGVDMFDCVMPSRAGRHGQVFTRHGKWNLKNARFADDPAPIDPESACGVARTYSRAYLHHLVKSQEILGSMLLTLINISYYQELTAAMRSAIEMGTFADFAAATEAGWNSGENAQP